MTENSNGPQQVPQGFFASAREGLQALSDYILIRCELAGIESKVVVRSLVKAALAFTVAVVCLITGFLFLSLSLVYVLAEVAGWGWGWALVISGIVLLILMAAGLFVARSFLQGKWFPVTLTELKKDSAWLSQKTTPNA